MRAYQAAVILLVAFAILTGIQTAVKTVDVSGMPDELQLVWDGVLYIFATSALTPLWVFIRNIYGYYENWANQKGEIEYEAKQFWATWLKYEEYVKALAALVIGLTMGTPLQPYAVYIAGGLAFLVDVIRKSLSDIAAV